MYNKDLSYKFEIRPILVSDVKQIASLHTKVFPDYFMTLMGQRFLELFYKQFVNQQRNYGFVAVYDTSIIGYIVGTTDSYSLYRNFYYNNFAMLALITFKGFMDSRLRRNIMSRTYHIRMAIKSLFCRKQKPNKTNYEINSSNCVARLLSIAVESQYRGSLYGIADQLVETFCKRLCQDGVDRVGLGVFTDNLPAIAFYNKNGWTQERITEGVIYFNRSTSM